MRKRRHHRKSKVARDPEEVKELRLERLKMKREVHWNNRFVLQTIPDLFVHRPRKIEAVSRGKYPLHSAYVEKERARLPQIQKQRLHDTVTRQNHRSFKIRQVKKEAETISKAKGEMSDIEGTKKEGKISRKERNKEKLQVKLQEKTKFFQININYKQLLGDIIDRATDKKHKSIRTIIERQIDSIGDKDNIYSRLEKLVDERKAMLCGIKQRGAATPLKQYLDFQIHSLQLVEQILKFKAFWEGIYHENLRSEKKVAFYYKDNNYFTEMNKQVSEITDKDPFLVQKTANAQKATNGEAHEQQLQERKEMMLKIRACELLLIEEELLVGL